MKTIIVTESQIETLRKNIDMVNEEVTFFSFMSHIKAYLKQLLNDPIYAKPDAFLLSNGLDGEKTLSLLVDNGIIIKDEKIDSSGEKDMFSVSYKIPRQNFERKIKRLYSKLYEQNTKELNEGVNQQLLAPNGKPSNLSTNLWQIVRTPQFKAWFGDWENNPNGASKVVDENGEPMVMIHNTYSKFTKFDTKKSIAKSGAIWFANEKAQQYIGGFRTNNEIPMTQMYCFLRIMNPCYEGMDAAYYAKEEGYDGVIVSEDGANVSIVYSSNQIKSINNLGDFSFDSEDINEESIINEDGEGVGGATAAANCNASAPITPLFGKPLRRKTIYVTQEQYDKLEKLKEAVEMDTTFGDFGYDAPPFNDKKNDPAYDHTNLIKNSVEDGQNGKV